MVRKSAPPAGKLSCAVIGAGQFFNYAYLPALNRKDSPLVISGILARDSEKFQEAQRGLRYTTRHFTDYEALLASGIETVLILLPNHLHAEFARQALDRGLHVFCEKPLAPNITEALALKAAAARSRRVLMVDFNERFLDRNRVLKSVLAEGRIGKLVSAHAFHNQDLRELPSFKSLHRDVTGGGVVHNAGIHFINLFRDWFGEPERVHAIFENHGLPPECGEDTAHCRFWFPNGLIATLDASLANAVDTSYERVQFLGSDGEIASDLKKSNILWRRREARTQLQIPCKREIITDSVFHALAGFAQSVRSGSPPETDVDDFIATMKVVEAITLSAQRRADVALAEITQSYAGRKSPLQDS